MMHLLIVKWKFLSVLRQPPLMGGQFRTIDNINNHLYLLTTTVSVL